MTRKSETEYRYVGGAPGELTGGRLLEPDGLVKLTDTQATDPHNAQLIKAGALIPTKERDAT